VPRPSQRLVLTTAKRSLTLFKPTILQFGFTNAPTTFQKKINNVLKKHLNEFVMAYLNNIIIYLKSKEKYKKNLMGFKKVL